MSTTRSQRIGIWIIAVVLSIGTIGSFFAVVLSNTNTANDNAKEQKLEDEYTKEYKEYQAKLTAQTKQLSDQYYSVLSQYTGEVGTFTAGDVKSLVTKDLKEGDGATIGSDTTYSAYYIGWTPDGKIFDQSIENGALKAPISGTGLIDGWTKGVQGMKLGGVRELTIPSDQAYGSTGSGDSIKPNTPIKFIVLAIPSPETIEAPTFEGSTTSE